MATGVDPTAGNRPAALTALAVGLLLVAVGVLAPLLAGARGEFLVFGRNYLHDAVHVLTGAVALAAGMYAGGRYANEAAVTLGVLYLVVAVAGVLFLGVFRQLIALNVADNALHLMLATVLLGVGLVFGVAET